jgi:hypothetical protein
MVKEEEGYEKKRKPKKDITKRTISGRIRD